MRNAAPNVEEVLIEAEITAEQEAESKILTDKIEAAFANDDRASLILMGFQDGMKGPEIRAEFTLSEKEYRATMRRIRYGAEKILDEHHGK